MQPGDLINIEVEAGRIDLVGVEGKRLAPEQIEATLAERRSRWKGPAKRRDGVLDLYCRQVGSTAAGATMF